MINNFLMLPPYYINLFNFALQHFSGLCFYIRFKMVNKTPFVNAKILKLSQNIPNEKAD